MANLKNKRLIFVYNADSGVKNSLLDSAHKFLKPETYECSLCQLTYGLFSENKKWKSFRKKSEIEFEFLHKDEYEKNFKSKFEALQPLPVILFQDNYDLDVFVSAEELNKMNDVSELIEKLQRRISNL
ncbi:GTPase [Psychroflexus aestuariivivens]|uniref:GTPase n=1 Tax=Psychroflexus aestuariivivens TaxID=1795040 RepID=UPI000FDB420F|nr:GTPase [Psychroflexus aestuariivivens]